MSRSPFAPSAPAVSVVVVAADSGAGLRECLHAVLAWSMPLECILIDNASSDGEPQALDRAFEGDARVRVIYNRSNLGFGPAVNRAAAHARSEALMVLNPDCIVPEADAVRLLAVLHAEERVGVVGAVVCDARGRPDPASWRRDPLFWRALATVAGFRRGGVNIARPLPTGVVEAEAVSGALLVMPRRAFERVGGFDPGYFLHCEDLDLCRRVRDAGYRVLLAGDVRVLHGKGGSSRHRPVFVSRWKHRGMWRWFRKFDPAARHPLLAGMVFIGIWTHFLLQLPILWWRLMRHRLRQGARHGSRHD